MGIFNQMSDALTHLITIGLILGATSVAGAAETSSPPVYLDLLDAKLTRWETFMGVPHETVKGLPEGTFQSKNVTQGTPLGLNNDPKKVFTTRQEDGSTILCISGEIYGGLTTREEFSDYHLSVEFRWGDQKWAPRAKAKRDSGLLYHCQGEHGAFWSVWKSCLEYQVQETDLGDLYPLAGGNAWSRFRTIDEKNRVFDVSFPWAQPKGSVSAAPENDRPHGEWNHLEIYTLGDSAIHVANGVVVLALNRATMKGKKSLTSGQLQIQSEGAECYYRKMRLTRIKAFPEAIGRQAGFGP
jgi:hypothetical protein